MEVSMKHSKFKDLPEQYISYDVTYLFSINSVLLKFPYIINFYTFYPLHGNNPFAREIPVNTRYNNPWVVRKAFLKPFCIACLQCKIHFSFYRQCKLFNHANWVVELAFRHILYKEFC